LMLAQGNCIYPGFASVVILRAVAESTAYMRRLCCHVTCTRYPVARYRRTHAFCLMDSTTQLRCAQNGGIYRPG
jgi:hypothetical protein